MESFDIVNVQQGISAHVFSVDDSKLLYGEASREGIPVNRCKLTYICKQGDKVTGGVFSYADNIKFESYPFVVQSFKGQGISEILCNTIINDYYDLYDTETVELRILVSTPMLVSVLERKGLVKSKFKGIGSKWTVLVLERQ